MDSIKNEKSLRCEELLCEAEGELHDVFGRVESVELANQKRVLDAFREEKISARHFAASTGYGYDDIGRDSFDRVFARVFYCEDALVRPQIVSGTHSIYTALDGLLQNNDTIIFASGMPYDTLESAIRHKDAFSGKHINNVVIDLDENGKIDTEKVVAALDSSVKIVYVQRSRGYAWRSALLPSDMEEVFAKVHDYSKDIITFVDNCYGEFTLEIEPTCVGADCIAGSLIKNPGGGLAPTGGYIAGKAECIERIENRLTVPGMGREVGSYAASYLPFFQGLFFAPHVTAQSLKSAALFAKLFEKQGLPTMPASDAVRSDIVQALRFDTATELVSFIQSIQRAAPVDSYVVPEPWDMPGYTDKVIMAAGTFVQGASIELSADAPIREPFTAYLQGALTYAHGRIAAEYVLNNLIDERGNRDISMRVNTIS